MPPLCPATLPPCRPRANLSKLARVANQRLLLVLLHTGNWKWTWKADLFDELSIWTQNSWTWSQSGGIKGGDILMTISGNCFYYHYYHHLCHHQRQNYHHDHHYHCHHHHHQRLSENQLKIVKATKSVGRSSKSRYWKTNNQKTLFETESQHNNATSEDVEEHRKRRKSVRFGKEEHPLRGAASVPSTGGWTVPRADRGVCNYWGPGTRPLECLSSTSH